jgi:hypothetical protein
MRLQSDITSTVHELEPLHIRGQALVASATLQPASLASAEVAVICFVISNYSVLY